MHLQSPPTQVLAHPSKQQRPKLGQSVSGCPGDQQFETAPAHSASLKGLALGHWPPSDPPSPPAAPASDPKAPSAKP